MSDAQIVVDSLRETAEFLSIRPWTTGIEEAMRELARTIEEKLNA